MVPIEPAVDNGVGEGVAAVEEGRKGAAAATCGDDDGGSGRLWLEPGN